MSISSATPFLTPSRSPSPEPPVQPDHFYGAEGIQLPPSPNSDGKAWLDPTDDPLATRGIPVFKPSMEEFTDFEAYMLRVECWGSRSGIVKIIPPKEWTAALPPLKEQLKEVKIKSPIEQHMFGRGGLFRQENMVKRKVMSVREWAELCAKEDYRAPGVDEIGLHARSATVKPKTRRTKKKATEVNSEVVDPDFDSIAVKDEPVDDVRPFVFGDSGSNNNPIVLCPPDNIVTPISPPSEPADAAPAETENILEEKPKTKRKVVPKRDKEAELAGRVARDLEFLETFEPHKHWLPPNTKPSDYTQEYCQKLERWYWRNCGLGKPAWYGADTMGSLYTDETTSWNVAHLESTLSRLLPSSGQGLPGVNTPYLYFGMWRATFAWHVEDMDLFSINYIHFGAPKFWYAVPQARAGALEQTMRGYFPKDTSNCPQFLRHKSFLASPTLLAQSSCRPNNLVQHCGEFVITYPRGYHAGFNLGLNCAESVNFALDSWLELGRRAKACECISDSVRIDVDQLLAERAEEAANPPKTPKPKRASSKKENENKDTKPKPPRKRKLENGEEAPKAKKLKIKLSPSKSGPSTSQPTKSALPKLSVTLKLGPRPTEPEAYPCCLCVSTNREGLLRVYDPPVGRKDAEDAAGNPKEWLAHEYCANVVPETWVDEIEIEANRIMEKVVFGVDGIVKDRWHLKCSACTKNRPKAHGAPIQCTKGKCPKAFHVSCARDGKDNGIVFDIVREVEKEVVLLEPMVPASSALVASEPLSQMQLDGPVPHTDGNGMSVDPSPTPSSTVLKVIKKFEVSVLCAQHNPAVAAAKKANKQDKIKAELLALPSMARIKMRVSAGVFEVSLIRVIEETSSVEVLWDRGVKREFKWGSVVFGNTDGPVQQRPSELAPEPQPSSAGLPVPTYSSVTAAAATARYTSQVNQSRPTASTSNVASTQPYGAAAPGQYPYPPRPGPYDYWSYQTPQYSAGQPSHPYGYAGYYANQTAVAGPSHQYNPYAYNQSQYPSAQMHWQQPYQGQQQAAYYRPPQQPQAGQQQHQIDQAATTTQGLQTSHSPVSNGPTHPQPSAVDLRQTSSSSSSESAVAPPIQDGQVQAQANSASGSPQPSFSAASHGAFKNLAALSSLEPSQISDILRENPQLRDIVLAALGEAQKVLPPIPP